MKYIIKLVFALSISIHSTEVLAQEKKPYDRGTNKLANFINSKKTLISIAGGGDTIAAIKKNKKIQNFSYLSTGGGAFLHWLEKFTLPGIEALKK